MGVGEHGATVILERGAGACVTPGGSGITHCGFQGKMWPLE